MGQDISSRGVCREFWLPFPGRAPSPGRGRVLPVPSSHTQRRVPEGIKAGCAGEPPQRGLTRTVAKGSSSGRSPAPQTVCPQCSPLPTPAHTPSAHSRLDPGQRWRGCKSCWQR